MKNMHGDPFSKYISPLEMKRWSDKDERGEEMHQYLSEYEMKTLEEEFEWYMDLIGYTDVPDDKLWTIFLLLKEEHNDFLQKAIGCRVMGSHAPSCEAQGASCVYNIRKSGERATCQASPEILRALSTFAKTGHVTQSIPLHDASSFKDINNIPWHFKWNGNANNSQAPRDLNVKKEYKMDVYDKYIEPLNKDKKLREYEIKTLDEQYEWFMDAFNFTNVPDDESWSLFLFVKEHHPEILNDAITCRVLKPLKQDCAQHPKCTWSLHNGSEQCHINPDLYADFQPSAEIPTISRSDKTNAAILRNQNALQFKW